MGGGDASNSLSMLVSSRLKHASGRHLQVIALAAHGGREQRIQLAGQIETFQGHPRQACGLTDYDQSSPMERSRKREHTKGSLRFVPLIYPFGSWEECAASKLQVAAEPQV